MAFRRLTPAEFEKWGPDQCRTLSDMLVDVDPPGEIIAISLGAEASQRNTLLQMIIGHQVKTPDGIPLWFPWIIRMPCKEAGIFDTIDDVTFANVPCPCGNPRHWILKWNILPDTIIKVPSDTTLEGTHIELKKP